MKTLIVAVLALALTACASPSGSADPADPAEVVTVTVTEPANVTDVTALDEREAEAEPASDTYVPRKRDFELSLTTLEKECYGSAGCLIDVRVELAYSGRDLDPAETYELTYEITGGDPITGTIDVQGDQYEVAEHQVDTEHDIEPQVRVLDVRHRGF